VSWARGNFVGKTETLLFFDLLAQRVASANPRFEKPIPAQIARGGASRKADITIGIDTRTGCRLYMARIATRFRWSLLAHCSMVHDRAEAAFFGSFQTSATCS